MKLTLVLMKLLRNVQGNKRMNGRFSVWDSEQIRTSQEVKIAQLLDTEIKMQLMKCLRNGNGCDFAVMKSILKMKTVATSLVSRLLWMLSQVFMSTVQIHLSPAFKKYHPDETRQFIPLKN